MSTPMKTAKAVTEAIAQSITFTTWASKTATNGKAETITWDDLSARLCAAPSSNSKGECRMLKLATFKRGCKAEDLEAFYGIEGDYDAQALSIDEGAARLSNAGVRAILYTSASHTPDRPRWRVLAPLSRPHTKEEHTALVSLLNGALGGILASESWTPAQRYYYGKVQGVIYESRSVEGVFLDQLDLVISPIGKVSSAASVGKLYTTPTSEEEDLERLSTLHGVTVETINDLRAAMICLEDWRAADRGEWITVLQALASLKETRFADDAFEIAQTFSERCVDKFDFDYLADTWRGMSPNQITYKSIFHKAEEDGWVNPLKRGRTNALEPIPFDTESPPTKWPTDALPQAMQQAAAAIADHVQAPEAVAAFAVLGAVAHLAQGIANAEGAKGDPIPCSLFTLALLGSGDRKSACFNLATAPISKAETKARIEHKHIVAELDRETKAKGKARTGEQSPAAKPADPRTIYGGDSTVEAIARDFVHGSKPALTWATDEGGIVFGGHSLKSETRLAAMGMFTRLFDGSGIDRSRVTEGIGSGFRFGIRFGMFLSCQPIVAREALADPMMQGQGLLPRFLLCAPDSLAGTRLESIERLSASPSNDARIQAYWSGLQCLMALPPQTDIDGNLFSLPIAGQNEDAKALWLDYYNRIETMQGADGEFANLKPFAGRSAEHASRLATVFAAWRCTVGNYPLQVSADDMRGAVAIAEFSLMEWQRHLTTCRLSPSERDAKTLLAWLQDKAWHQFTLTKLAQEGANFLRKDAVSRRAAVQELCKRGWLQEHTGSYVLVNGGV